MKLLELKESGASKLLSNLVQADVIEPVSGHGKGKYKFKKCKYTMSHFPLKVV